MVTPEKDKLRFLTLALWAASAAFIGLYLFTVLQRLPYPYDLEWMEGSLLLHSLQLLEGKPLFAPPSAEFIPFMYTPFYHLLIMLPVKIFGPHLWAGRLVGILASLMIAYLLYRIVWKESHNHLAAFTAGGLFLASYRFTGAWMDLLRMDTFQLLLLLFGFYALRYYKEGVGGVLLSAGVFTLAYLTKQSAPIFIAVAGLALLWEDKKKAFLFLFSSGLFIGGSILIANYLSDNWFWFYTFTTLKHYDFEPSFFLHYFLKDLLRNLPFILLLIIAWYGYQFSKRNKDALPGFWGFAFIAGFLSSLFMRSKSGGYTNSYLTLCCFAPLLAGLILGKSAQFKPWLRSLVMVVLLLQFYRFGYNPLNQLPSQADRQAGKALISRIASFPGPVLIPSHPFYAQMAGKEAHLNEDALRDVLGTGYPMPEDLANKIRQQYYSAIIFDEFDNKLEEVHPLRPLIEEAYYLAEELFAPGDKSFYPITGYWARPNYLYLPKGHLEK